MNNQIKFMSVFLALSLSTPMLNAKQSLRSYDSVNKNVNVIAGEVVGSIDSVNGNIKIAKNAQVKEIETVNGNVTLAEKVVVKSIDSVNGNIHAKQNIIIEKNISSVNGKITLLAGSLVKGSIDSVNGNIELKNVRVGGNIVVANSDVILTSGTIISGDLIIKKNKNKAWFFGLFSSSTGNKPKIIIGDNVKIKGKIVFNRRVNLKLSDSAKIPQITYAYKK